MKLNFKPFDPIKDSEAILPNSPGNYFLCLKPNAKLPKIPTELYFQTWDGLRVLYTGVSSDIKRRDYRQHFNGTAGRSTLRKSIGVLFGYKQIPRDSDPSNGKTKFCDSDENALSKWMKNNLILYYLVNPAYDEFEQLLIDRYNPPLNISKNSNIPNKDFRSYLSSLRKVK